MKTKIPQYCCKLVRERTVTYPVPKIEHDGHGAQILHAMLDSSDREQFCVIYLNGQQVPVGCEVIAIGGLNGCGVDIRLVLKGAILAGANAIIVGHNHPSGDPTPSAEDRETTTQLCKAAKTIGIPIVDHIITSRDGRHSSFNTLGLL